MKIFFLHPFTPGFKAGLTLGLFTNLKIEDITKDIRRNSASPDVLRATIVCSNQNNNKVLTA